MEKSRKEILDALGAYQRANEDSDFGAAVEDAYTKETDRGYVVILGSLTEDELIAHVFRKWPSISNTMRKELTRGGGPLGSWAQISKLALAMGIIDHGDSHDLEVFKVLRNACAHSRKHIDFHTPEVRGALSLLMGENVYGFRENKAGAALLRRLVQHIFIYLWGRIGDRSPKRTPDERFADWLAQMRAMERRPALPRKRPPRRLKTSSRGPQKPKRPRPPQSSQS
jgi:hypothetical protein